MTTSYARAFASPTSASAEGSPAGAPPPANTGMSVAATYAATAAAIAATMTPNDFLCGKPNSSDIPDIASNPTNSHGDMARMLANWRKGAPPTGEKRGNADAPTACLDAAAAKHTAMPTTSIRANAVCAAAATRPLRHSETTTAIASATTAMSPTNTSTPATENVSACMRELPPAM